MIGLIGLLFASSQELLDTAMNMLIKRHYDFIQRNIFS